MSKSSRSLSWFLEGPRSWFRKSRFFLYHRSENENVFHCTVQKSASQWIRSIAADERMYRYSGLTSYQYTQEMPGGHDPRNIIEVSFDKPFPSGTFVTPLYIDYHNFQKIPKPRKYKAFFVMRDPRDLLISWYFSAKYSHALIGEQLERIRQELSRLDVEDGLLYGIDYLKSYGLFNAQRSWAGAPTRDPNVMLVKYEQLIGPNNVKLFRQVLNHCDIRIPDEQLNELLKTYSFENLSGRKRGQEDQKAHYRKGVQGDWKNYITDKIQNRFMEASGDLLAAWGYED
jgi:hypothetical protein